MPQSGAVRSDKTIPSNGYVAAYEPVDRVFQGVCVRCHNSTRPAHGVDLTSYDRVMHGREAHGPIVTVGNPDGSVLMQALRGHQGRKANGTSPHVRVVGRFDERDLLTIEHWMRQGAQPNGTLQERWAATLPQYVVALDDGQRGYRRANGRYTRSLSDLFVIPVAGVEITMLRADAQSWQSRITHPAVSTACVFGRTVDEKPRALEPATA